MDHTDAVTRDVMTRDGMTLAALTRVERALLRVNKQHGSRPFVAAVTGISIGLSLLVTIPALLAIGTERADFIVGLVICIAVPGLVAPIAAAMLARLLRALDIATTELHHLARVDALTGALNRRAFTLAAEALIAARGDDTVVVAMVDIDDFKGVNDHFGHTTGDTVLVHLAEALAAYVGDRGVVGRFGGDEFVTVCCAGESEIAHLERVLASACDLSSVLGGVRASFGVRVADAGDSLAEAMASADHALYRAKARRPVGASNSTRTAGHV